MREASDRMEIGYQHAKRLRHVVVRDGPRGTVHGHTGTKAGNAIDLAVKQKIVELPRTHYASFNDTHFAEKFATDHRIWISRETFRKRGVEGLPDIDPVRLAGAGRA